MNLLHVLALAMGKFYVTFIECLNCWQAANLAMKRNEFVSLFSFFFLSFAKILLLLSRDMIRNVRLGHGLFQILRKERNAKVGHPSQRLCDYYFHSGVSHSFSE